MMPPLSSPPSMGGPVLSRPQAVSKEARGGWFRQFSLVHPHPCGELAEPSILPHRGGGDSPSRALMTNHRILRASSINPRGCNARELLGRPGVRPYYVLLGGRRPLIDQFVRVVLHLGVPPAPPPRRFMEALRKGSPPRPPLRVVRLSLGRAASQTSCYIQSTRSQRQVHSQRHRESPG